MVFMNPGNRIWRYLLSFILFMMSLNIAPEYVICLEELSHKCYGQLDGDKVPVANVAMDVVPIANIALDITHSLFDFLFF